MTSWPGHLLSRARDEGGHTLVEMLVCCALFVVIAIPTLDLLDRSVAITTADQERAIAISEVRTGLVRMDRELRQAYAVNSQTATKVDVGVVVLGVDQRVVYDCAEPHPTDASLKRCARWTVVGGVSSAKQVVIDRIVNGASPVFALTYSGVKPLYMTVDIRVPSRGERKVGAGHTHDIRLDDGFVLRNAGALS